MVTSRNHDAASCRACYLENTKPVCATCEVNYLRNLQTAVAEIEDDRAQIGYSILEFEEM